MAMEDAGDSPCFDFARLSSEEESVHSGLMKQKRLREMELDETAAKASRISTAAVPSSDPSADMVAEGPRDCSTWAAWMQGHFANDFQAKGEQKHPVLIDSVCSGMATHTLGLKVLPARLPMHTSSVNKLMQCILYKICRVSCSQCVVCQLCKMIEHLLYSVKPPLQASEIVIYGLV